MEGADVETVLRERGHRVTRPRTAVWAALVEAEEHLTAEEVADRVEVREAGVNLASVYRTLTLFEELDLVRQSRLADDMAGRWELTHSDEAFHMVCTGCGQVDHHDGTLVQSIKDHLTGGHGFEVDKVELTVSGRCPSCVARAVTEGTETRS